MRTAVQGCGLVYHLAGEMRDPAQLQATNIEDFESGSGVGPTSCFFARALFRHTDDARGCLADLNQSGLEIAIRAC